MVRIHASPPTSNKLYIMKNPKKLITDDKSINEAELKLGINYPRELREMLKKRNGFYLGGYRFFCVLDKDDLEHTFDDVVRENTNPIAGWKQLLPEGFVAIASDEGQGCLVLNTNKDGKVYYWNNDMTKMEVYSENGHDFETRIKADEEEIAKL
jgi:hypothetical protein